jgi:hypothetical protein
MQLELLLPIAAALLAVVSALGRYLLESWRKKREKERERNVRGLLNLNVGIDGLIYDEDSRTLDELLGKEGRRSLDLVAVSSPAASPNASALTVSTEIEALKKQLQSLSKQVIESKNEIIEVQTIDPILEATLKAAVENLVKRVELLEKQSLTKWDVALIVAQILGTLGLLLGLTFGIIKYLHP